MYSKCELIINNVAYHVTNELKNWDDISSTFKRSDYDGVVRSFSNKFEFTGGAYDLLKTEYRKNYLSSSAAIAYYTRNNSWLWNERFRLSLDFSTFSDDGSVISINAIDNSLASLIKAKKGTQYEYSMAQIEDRKTLYYDRLEIDNNIKYLIAGQETDDDGNAIIHFKYDLEHGGNTIKPIVQYMGNPEVMKDMGFEYTDIPDNRGWDNMFFKTTELEVIGRLDSNVSIRAYNSIGVKNVSVRISKISSSGVATPFSESFPIAIGDEYTDIKLTGNGELKKGEGLSMIITVIPIESNSRNHSIDLIIKGDSRVELSFYAKGDPVDIDIITPTTVLNRLLQSMNGGKPGITGEIMKGVDERLDNCVIVPAESARALPKAKFYTSYSKFTDWMKAVFGFVPIIEENKVRFVHRDMLFQDKVVKEIESTRDFEYSVNSSLVYSRVRVGYDKQDYESVNGKDEFRFTNEYTTGIELTDNSLELISPYRADAYGIEFLVQKRGEDTTDDTSDNDVFFVNAKVKTIITGNGPLEMNTYELVRSGYTLSGVISPDTMFNVAYAPRFMINANKRLIGASIDNLNFASSDGNSEVVIDGVPESADISLSERLFTAGKVSFETGDLNIPSDFSGLVAFTKNGEEYKGFIENVTINYGRAEAVKYSLIVNSIEKSK